MTLDQNPLPNFSIALTLAVISLCMNLLFAVVFIAGGDGATVVLGILIILLSLGLAFALVRRFVWVRICTIVMFAVEATAVGLIFLLATPQARDGVSYSTIIALGFMYAATSLIAIIDPAFKKFVENRGKKKS